jgi:hypothetical protein
MYGTVAKMRVKPGMEQQLIELSKDEDMVGIPGLVSSIIYKMDSDPNEYYLAVIFESKDAYDKNADSPEQHARYQEYMKCLEGDPEWHDGEIVYRTGG